MLRFLTLVVCMLSLGACDKITGTKKTKEDRAPLAKPSEAKRTKGKGGGERDAKEAKVADQKLGDAARKAEATKKEAVWDGLSCNASTEGVAFCDSNSSLIFCADNAWREIDCAKAVSGSFCGYDSATHRVDCFQGAVLVDGPNDEDEDPPEAEDEGDEE